MTGRQRSAVSLKSREDLKRMRRAGEIVALVLEAVELRVVPGVTTGELDTLAEGLIRDLGAEPSFKGYHGYPAAICASVNEEVVHGMPGERRLRSGDILSVDVGTIWEGWQGDGAMTFPVGEIDERLRGLLRATQQALADGIRAARAGAQLGAVSHAIEAVGRAAGLGVVREYGGHGIGRRMHEPPNVPNWGPADAGPRLAAGMTLALEPMFALGGADTRVLEDQWTVVTRDGSPSAHFEHTIAITEDGAEILTRRPDL